ncbi:universal stress protein [Noviherbaspirillum saxi]|uniref:Universal stress protein n=1 Tax=Noviherbaspirillum saxi TaxID=2320863 RepID=A0A3A3FF31_9BURK|nr:universal stress protein [Noviherbaspirillum saxi]RJF91946.1 universal stress protein [Noviherbaspirillum saxi]
MMRDVEILPVHARNPVESLFLHHRHIQAIRTAKRPVLLTDSERSHAYRKILVPVDFTETAKTAAQFVLDCYPYAQMVFLHALPVTDYKLHDADLRSKAALPCKVQAWQSSRENLRRFIDELNPGQQLLSGVVHSGSSLTVISDYAVRMRADLIVIGIERSSWIEALVLGSAAWRLAKTLDTDVLAVPACYRRHNSAISKQAVPMLKNSTCFSSGR